MTRNNFSTTTRKFQHLTKEKRAQLEILLKIEPKMSKKKIAQELGIARSTLYEELKRGTVEQMDTNLVKHNVYFADVGQRVYEEHRKNSRNPYKLGKAGEFIEYAEEKILKEKLSPDAVVGYAVRNNMFNDIISTKTLYNYIDRGLLKVRNIDLALRVKIKPKVRRDRKYRRILGESIENRPTEISDRITFGHWEIDTIVGTKDTSAVLLTLDERLTRKRIIRKIKSRSAAEVNKALREIMKEYGDLAPQIFKSITADNGSEFAHLSESVKFTKVYYAHPYSSYERGTNENQNGLVRRFFPKGKSFEDVADCAIARVEDWINFLPRKIFNYACSNDLFNEYVNLL